MKIRAAVVVSILIALPVFAQEVEKSEAAPSGASESSQSPTQAASQARPELRPVTNGTPDHLAKFDAAGTTDSGIVETSDGKVGIGTTTPAQKVHVFEAADVQALFLLQNISAASNSSAAIRAQSDLAMTNLISHATGRTISRYGVVLGGWSELLSFQANGLVMGTVSSTPVIIGTSNIDRIHVTGAGDVGIGIATPSAKLHVAGNIIATGSITGATVIGAVYQDVAEWVPAAEHLEPGTVVVVDKRTGNTVRASMTAYDTSVAGVVSAQPGIILGEGSASKEQVATTGRVRVRVDASKEAIQLGDLLVTSDIPGTAMKSEPIDVGGVSIHRPGTIIGKALEPLDRGEGEILVLLSLQ